MFTILTVVNERNGRRETPVLLYGLPSSQVLTFKRAKKTYCLLSELFPSLREALRAKRFFQSVLPYRGRGLYGAPTRNEVSYGESGGMSRLNEARACRRPHSFATSLPNARSSLRSGICVKKILTRREEHSVSYHFRRLQRSM